MDRSQGETRVVCTCYSIDTYAIVAPNKNKQSLNKIYYWEIFHETVATAFNVRIVGALGYSITPYSLVAKTKV